MAGGLKQSGPGGEPIHADGAHLAIGEIGLSQHLQRFQELDHLGAIAGRQSLKRQARVARLAAKLQALLPPGGV